MNRRFGVRLRSVLFHEIADIGSTYTEGLGVRMDVQTFQSRLRFLSKHYKIVSLQDVRDALEGVPLPRRALLITFDDAYSSVSETAATLLDSAGIPSVFFVNADSIDHRSINTDNLAAHVANVVGHEALARAAARVRPHFTSVTLGCLLGEIVPTFTQAEVRELRSALTAELDHDPLERARVENLYMTRSQLLSLPTSMEIGNHTGSHVRCRSLLDDEIESEISGAKDRLELMSSRQVDSFSVPYGSEADLTPSVLDGVMSSGHDLVFLVEGRLNHGELHGDRIVRVSLSAHGDIGTAVEIEVLPRLRRLRNQVRGLRTR